MLVPHHMPFLLKQGSENWRKRAARILGKAWYPQDLKLRDASTLVDPQALSGTKRAIFGLLKSEPKQGASLGAQRTSELGNTH